MFFTEIYEFSISFAGELITPEFLQMKRVFARPGNLINKKLIQLDAGLTSKINFFLPIKSKLFLSTVYDIIWTVGLMKQPTVKLKI